MKSWRATSRSDRKDRPPGYGAGRGMKPLDGSTSARQEDALNLKKSYAGAPVAQLDRALASGARGREFESPWARHSSAFTLSKIKSNDSLYLSSQIRVKTCDVRTLRPVNLTVGIPPIEFIGHLIDFRLIGLSQCRHRAACEFIESESISESPEVLGGFQRDAGTSLSYTEVNVRPRM